MQGGHESRAVLAGQLVSADDDQWLLGGLQFLREWMVAAGNVPDQRGIVSKVLKRYESKFSEKLLELNC